MATKHDAEIGDLGADRAVETFGTVVARAREAGRPVERSPPCILRGWPRGSFLAGAG